MEEEKPHIPSHGVPGKETIWFPSNEKWNSTKDTVRWELEDIIQHIYPKQYQLVYHAVALEIMRSLLENPNGIDGDMLGKWISEKKISKATFYNRVLPHLIDIGMIKRERIHGEKGRKMVLYPSERFSICLKKLCSEWTSQVDTARERKR